MLRSTFAGFTTAQLAMAASQRALDVTGQNISNINTSGYTRQRLDLASISVTGASHAMKQSDSRVGQGVQMTGITQIRDPYLDIQYRNHLAEVGTIDAQNSVLSEIGSIFDEVDATAIRAALNDVVKQLQNMAQPGNSSETSSEELVKSAMEVLLNLFHENGKALEGVDSELIQKLEETDIANINQYLTSIKQLNESIKNTQVLGGPALELIDQRNQLIDELATYLPISVSYKTEDLGGGIKVDTLKIEIVGAKDRYVLVDDDKVGQIYVDSSRDTGKVEIQVREADSFDDANKIFPSAEMIKKINDLAQKIARYNLDLPALQESIDALDATLTDAKNAWNTKLNELGWPVGTDPFQFPAATDKQLAAVQASAERLAAATKAWQNEQGTASPDRLKALKAEYTAANAALVSDLYDAGYRNWNNGMSTGQDDPVLVPDGKFVITDSRGNEITLIDSTAPDTVFKLPTSQQITEINEITGKIGRTQDRLTALGNQQQEIINNRDDAVKLLENQLGLLNYKIKENTLGPDGTGKLTIETPDGKELPLVTDAKADTFSYPTIQASDVAVINDALETLRDINKKLAKGGLGTEEEKKLLAQQQDAITNLENTFTKLSVDMTVTKDQNGFLTGITIEGVTDQTPVTLLQGDKATGTNIAALQFDNGTGVSISGVEAGDLDTITEDLTDGVLKGYLDALNDKGLFNGTEFKGIGYYADYFDAFVNEFATTLNTLNREYLYKPDGTPDLDAQGNHKYNERPLFETTDKTGNFTATNIKIAEGWKNKDYSIKINDNGTSSGNENILKMIEALTSEIHKVTVQGKDGNDMIAFEGTLLDAYDHIQKTQATDQKSTDSILNNRLSVLNQIADSKDSVSGVYMDEEVMNLMRFQQSYNAAARVMTTLDEILNTLINSTGIVGR